MTKAEALELLKDIVEELDYDIYKNIFIENCMEDPEAAEVSQNALLAVLKKHIEVE